MSNYDRVFDALVEQIDDDPTGNPRQSFDEREIRALAVSMQSVGIQVPLILMRGEKLPFRLLDGWRRFRAAKLLGLKVVPAMIQEKPLCEGDRLQHQLIINCQRCDLSPLEKARAIARLMEVTSWNASETAKGLGMSSAGISRSLRLLTLDQPIQQLIEAGRVAPSTAYAIAQISDAEQRLQLAREAANGELTRDAVNARASEVAASSPVPAEPAKADASAPTSDNNHSASVGPPALRRFTAALVDATVTISGVGLTPDTALALLAQVLAQARKLKDKQLAPDEFFRALRERLRSA
jgi:ParB family chromosome partitioning protein